MFSFYLFLIILFLGGGTKKTSGLKNNTISEKRDEVNVDAQPVARSERCLRPSGRAGAAQGPRPQTQQLPWCQSCQRI